MAKKKNTDTEIVVVSNNELVTTCDQLVPAAAIEKMIFTFRKEQVMVDRDLAMLYGVETRVLNYCCPKKNNSHQLKIIQ